MSHIAIDYGTRKSGLAYSVEDFTFAYKTVATKSLKQELTKLIDERNPESIIIGMPYNIDGSTSVHGKRVEIIQRELQKLYTLPILLHDERLTTSEARIHYSEIGEEADIDAEAARLILEDYMRMKKEDMRKKGGRL